MAVQYESDGGTVWAAANNNNALAVPLPATRPLGSVLLLAAWCRLITAAAPAPAGYTLLGTFTSATAAGGRIWLYARIVDGSEVAPSCTPAGVTGTTGDVWGACLYCYSGVDTSGGIGAILDGTPTVTDTSGTTTNTYPALTIARADSMIVRFLARFRDALETFTPTATWNEREDAATTNRTGGQHHWQDKLATAAGVQAAVTVAPSVTSSGRYLAVTAALKAAVAAPIGNELAVVADLEVPVVQELALRADLLAPAAQELALVYDLLAPAVVPVGKSLEVLFELRAAAGETLALRADLRSLGGETLALRADLRAAAAEQLALAADLRALAGEPLALRADVRALAAETLALRADLRAAAAEQLTLLADLLVPGASAVSETLLVRADLRATRSELLAAAADLRSVIYESLIAVGDLRATRSELLAAAADLAALRSETLAVASDLLLVAGEPLVVVYELAGAGLIAGTLVVSAAAPQARTSADLGPSSVSSASAPRVETQADSPPGVVAS